MKNLEGKVALVTGASKALARPSRRELAARGAAVAVNYSGSKAGADKVVAEIKAAGGKAIAVQANLADPDTIGPLVEKDGARARTHQHSGEQRRRVRVRAARAGHTGALSQAIQS